MKLFFTNCLVIPIRLNLEIYLQILQRILLTVKEEVIQLPGGLLNPDGLKMLVRIRNSKLASLCFGKDQKMMLDFALNTDSVNIFSWLIDGLLPMISREMTNG